MGREDRLLKIVQEKFPKSRESRRGNIFVNFPTGLVWVNIKANHLNIVPNWENIKQEGIAINDFLQRLKEVLKKIKSELILDNKEFVDENNKGYYALYVDEVLNEYLENYN